MSRTLSERVTDWRWWGEQGLHVCLGGATAAFTMIGNPIAACTSAAAWLATVRELIDQWPVDSWGDMAIDWVCTVLGGLALGVIIWAVTA